MTWDIFASQQLAVEVKLLSCATTTLLPAIRGARM